MSGGIRCDGCDGKFGAAGEAEVEDDSFEVNESTVNVEAKVSVPCGNCGNELQEGYTSIEAEIDTETHNAECEITDPATDQPVTLESDEDRFLALVEGERTFDCTSVTLEISDDFRPHFIEVRDRKSGEITKKAAPRRSQRHYYDITGTANVTCNACGKDLEVELAGEMLSTELEPV